MNPHLSEDELTTILAGIEASPAATEHLESCVVCRRHVAELRRFVAERRGAMEADAPDWDVQRDRIMSRLQDGPPADRRMPRRWLRPVLAAAAVLVIAIGVRLAVQPNAVAPPPGDLRVEEILAEVDEVLADDSVPGFESIDPGLDDPASVFENGAS